MGLADLVVGFCVFAYAGTSPRSALNSSELLRHLLDGSRWPPVLRDDAAVSAEVVGHPGRIPRLILQTLNRKRQLPAPIAAGLGAWQRMNPEYEHELHDAADMRRLIQREFDASFLRIFDALGQYQQRADLWRLCALYLRGGVYVDADYAPLQPLRSFLADPRLELVVPLCAPLVLDPLQPPSGCHARPEALRRLQNGFIAAAPRQPALYVALARLRWNWYRRESQHYLAAMGPALLYEAYVAVHGDPLASVLKGPREHGALQAVDLAPFVGRRHRPETLLLLEADRLVVLPPGEGEPSDAVPIPLMLHKYVGWEESIAELRDDNSSRVSRGGTCLVGFR